MQTTTNNSSLKVVATNDDSNQENKRENIISINELTKHRKLLPSAMFDRSSVSIWSVLKQCIGKELYRFTIPIIWNEPLSLLQRTAENIKFADDLLDKAAKKHDPIERMEYVAAHIISCTSINVNRLSKPFNPLLGETYEYVDVERNYRIVCEQVSHHPPITAFYAESLLLNKANQPLWKYYGQIYPVLKLNVMSAAIEAYPEGIQTIEIPEFNETYTWFPPKIFAHNLLIGKLWFEFHGKIDITNHKLNLKCKLDFIPYSWFSKGLNRVEGYISDENLNEKRISVLGGKWDEYFYGSRESNIEPSNFVKLLEKTVESSDSSKKASSKSKHKGNNNELQLFWKLSNQPAELSECHEDYYNFTDFTFRLNQLNSEHESNTLVEIVDKNNSKPSSARYVSLGPLPKTDSRYRTDLRLYENGELEKATTEKERLEENQRTRRHQMESGDLEMYKPIWFNNQSHPCVDGEETWLFNGNYWDRDFTKCPDLFS